MLLHRDDLHRKTDSHESHLSSWTLDSNEGVRLQEFGRGASCSKKDSPSEAPEDLALAIKRRRRKAEACRMLRHLEAKFRQRMQIQTHSVKDLKIDRKCDLKGYKIFYYHYYYY